MYENNSGHLVKDYFGMVDHHVVTQDVFGSLILSLSVSPKLFLFITGIPLPPTDFLRINFIFFSVALGALEGGK